MRKGFTLIEILVVISISALLVGIVITGQREFSRRKVADNAATNIITTLRQTQTQSASGVKPNDSNCQGNYRLDGYSATFSSTGYTIRALCSDGVNNREVATNTFDYPAGVVASSYPAQPIIFRSVGEGTNINGSESVILCAFNYGQQIMINEKGDISNQEVSCSATPLPTPVPTIDPECGVEKTIAHSGFPYNRSSDFNVTYTPPSVPEEPNVQFFRVIARFHDNNSNWQWTARVTLNDGGQYRLEPNGCNTVSSSGLGKYDVCSGGANRDHPFVIPNYQSNPGTTINDVFIDFDEVGGSENLTFQSLTWHYRKVCS